jgi:hypothetical protein
VGHNVHIGPTVLEVLVAILDVHAPGEYLDVSIYPGGRSPLPEFLDGLLDQAVRDQDQDRNVPGIYQGLDGFDVDPSLSGAGAILDQQGLFVHDRVDGSILMRANRDMGLYSGWSGRRLPYCFLLRFAVATPIVNTSCTREHLAGGE